MKSIYGTTEAVENPREGRVYLAAFTGTKKINVRLKKEFINLLRSEKYDEINKALSESKYTPQQVDSFLVEEGYDFLKYGTLASRIGPLDFIAGKMNPPHQEAVKQVFNNNKINFLEGLLYVQKMAEMRGENSQSERELLVEKFIRLLEIEPDGVQALMSAYTSNEAYMTPSIAEDYQTALKRFQEERKPSPKY